MRTIKLPLFLALLLVVIFASISIAAWNLFDKNLPAPPITNSPMLNEKVELLRANGLSGYQIIAVGSSMTANNLDSAVIREAFTDGRYINMAAGNLKMQEVRELCLCLAETVSPDYFIVNSNLMDFYKEKASIGIADYKVYLESKWPNTFYMKYWNPKYFWRFYTQYAPLRETRKDYGSLAFDENGGAPLEIYGADINRARYNHLPEYDLLYDSQYKHLELLAAELAEAGITLIFVQSSYRSGVVGHIETEQLHRHIDRVQSIVQTPHIFIDTTVETWDDSLFCDYSHFNARGAEQYTRYIVNSLPDSLN
ncbi:MAG: hypothetical protein K8R90_05585 [Candidatus Cloacimonetes bacterium]|nr:hypothetical protein [Candidatus Cloacimonadota bacterium]